MDGSGDKGRRQSHDNKKGLTAKEKRKKYVSKKKKRQQQHPHATSIQNHNTNMKHARSEKGGNNNNSHEASESTTTTTTNTAETAKASWRSTNVKDNVRPPPRGMPHRNKEMSTPQALSSSIPAMAPPPDSSKIVHHRFEVDETDHCETPLEAYQDIVSILDYWAKCIGKHRADLVIYDPYYCSGGIKGRLGSLGFTNVWNENEDFYDNLEKGNIPEYDVLLTNPPYSGIHIEKLLKFASGGGTTTQTTKFTNKYKHRNRTSFPKPFLLLLPHFVYTKDYYKRIYHAGDNNHHPNHPFFLCPRSRYSYVPPSWVSEEGSTSIAKGKVKTAPFPSFWYCHGGKGDTQKDLSSFLRQTYGESGAFQGFDSKKLQYAKCTEHIPREMRGELDTNKKRPNPRARKRMMAKKRKAMAP